MLDIDFIRNPLLPDKTVIYFYRSGHLRPELKRALRKAATDHGRVAVSASPADERSLGDDSMFAPDNELIYCDCGEPGSSLKDAQIFHRLKSVSNGTGKTVQIVPWNERIPEQDYWLGIQNNCFVIEEPPVTEATLPQILRYLDETVGSLSDKRLSQDPKFIRIFREISGAPHVDLSHVAREYRRQLVTCTDPETRQFDHSLHQTMRRDEVAGSSPLGKLKALIREPTPHALDAFVRIVAKRASDQQWAPDRLYAELCKLTRRALVAATQDIITRRSKRNSSSNATLASRDMALWVGLLVASTNSILDYTLRRVETVRGPNTMLAHLHDLCRQFQQHRSRNCVESDRLHGRWEEIESACATETQNSAVRHSMLQMAHAFIDWHAAARLELGVSNLLGAFERLSVHRPGLTTVSSDR